MKIRNKLLLFGCVFALVGTSDLLCARKNKQNRKRPGSPGLQSYSTIMYDGTVRAPFRVVRDQKNTKNRGAIRPKKNRRVPAFLSLLIT